MLGPDLALLCLDQFHTGVKGMDIGLLLFSINTQEAFASCLPYHTLQWQTLVVALENRKLWVR